MTRLLLIILVILVGGIFALGSWLAVDDLYDCAVPDGRNAVCAPADAIVAISGGDTKARTKTAIELYLAGWAPTLLFSGAAEDANSPSNAEVMRSQALEAGVPANALLVDTKAADTTQNAAGARQLLGSDVKRVILVTSPYHQRRASLEFEKQFAADVVIINRPTWEDPAWPPHWWLTRSGWWLAFTESIKALFVMVTP